MTRAEKMRPPTEARTRTRAHPGARWRAGIKWLQVTALSLAAGAAGFFLALSATAHAPNDAFAAHAEAALRKRPCDIGVRLSRARRAIDAGNTALAASDLAAVQKCAPDAQAPVHAERARLARQSLALPLALHNAERARQLAPENAAYTFLLGELQAQAGERTLAARTLSDAYRLAPTPDVALARIRLARDVGDDVRALHLSTEAWAKMGAVPAIVRAAVFAARATGSYAPVLAALEADGATRRLPPRYALYATDLALRSDERESARKWLTRFAQPAMRRPGALGHLADEYRRALGEKRKRSAP